MNKKQFELKPEHIKLLKKAWVRWEDCEHGAPAIDCKRPYGNKFVEGDIAEILEIEPDTKDCDGDPDFSYELRSELNEFHKETMTALEIIIHCCDIQLGIYEAEKYSNDWQPSNSNSTVTPAAEEPPLCIRCRCVLK